MVKAAAEENQLPRNVRWEMARLARFGPIVADSLRFSEHKSGAASILFDIKTDLQLEPSETPIHDIEPIFFAYPSSRGIGKVAPRVLSARQDFPRNLSHINPGSRSQPVSLCVARAGHQAIYDAAGVEGIARRTLTWLNDAKCETLYDEGWDPVPIATIEQGVIGYFDAEALQLHAAAHADGGYGFICAGLNHGDENQVFLHSESTVLKISDMNDVGEAKKAMSMSKKELHVFDAVIPTVFCWPARAQVEHDPHFGDWQDMKSLTDGLRETSLREHVDTAFLMLDPLFGDDQDSDKRGHKAILIIVGLWRPAPLDPTIVGLANDQDARCLELRAFYLQRDNGIANRWSSATNVRPFFGMVPTLLETLAVVSGEPALAKTAVLGAGALGSAFVSYAVRGGARHVSVIDNDIVLSHNMARHRASRGHVGHNKAEIAAELALDWAQDASVKSHSADIIEMAEDELQAAIADCEQVWDATANPLVRRKLSKLNSPCLPVMRTEIFHHGRLGVTLMTRIGASQNLNNVFHQLVALGMQDEWVRDWLTYEASRSFLDEELLLGFGCHSFTTKMPAYKIDCHAAAAYAIASAADKVFMTRTGLVGSIG
ncbi:MAG: ThiF family adenylyltransferase, partial [Planctomycetes bacterium]|nr:ThiF family adenylyltransferase [Planctomycetota bacterium]